MSSYFAYFKIKFLNEIQYKVAAIAGICTQIAWGAMYIMLYTVFLNNSSNKTMSISQMSTYIWLQQSLFMLFNIWSVDNNILEQIKDGSISMELLKPVELYKIWHAKTLGRKLALVILRVIPLFIICNILPLGIYGFSLPTDLKVGILFLITLILATLLVMSYIMLIYIAVIFTKSQRGIKMVFQLFAEFFSGLVIPLAFLPDVLINIIKFTPFYYMQNLPFNIYIGYTKDLKEIIFSIIVQILWIIVLTIFGKIVLKKKIKKIEIQGG